MILLVDNYDSFTYNLAHLFQELGADVTVLRNDAIDADEAVAALRRRFTIENAIDIEEQKLHRPSN